MTSRSDPESVFRFGRCELRAAERVLLVDGAPAKLGARAFDILLALVERRERVVPRPELMQLVWPRVIVEDNNLQVHMVALRKLLGPTTIATLPGRGYRFTAPLLDDAAPALAAPRPAEHSPLAVATTNLPADPVALFGRAGDAQAVVALLDGARLVTLVGPGGVGKTRLAQAVAQQLAPRFADGVWQVDLAPLAEPGPLPAAVALALGIALPGVDPRAELVAALRARQLLLLLDNCEHLIEAVGSFAQALLAAAAGVRVLTTSQEMLKTGGEQVYRLASLAVPARDDDAEALGYGAVRLFVERVRALDPSFAPAGPALAGVVDICRRLDGMALAIELAAARVPLLGVDGVRERLGERLRVLTNGSRSALPKHQTLRAAFDWSWGLLAPLDQVVFRRLGVFTGGFTMELAQTVVAADTLDAWAVLDHLGALVDKSLVVAEGAARPRYRLLETARAYALEQLGQAQETATFLRAHARAMRDLFERALAPADAGAPPDAALADRWAAERDNLRAAMEWAVAEGDASSTVMALSTASASSSFMAGLMRALVTRGNLDEALRAAREALPRLRRAGAFFACAPAFAWLLACRRQDAAAAQLLGAAAAFQQRSSAALEPNAAECREQALALLRAAHGAAQLRNWQQHGAAMDEDALAALIEAAA